MLFIPTALVLSSCSISIRRAGFSRSKQSLKEAYYLSSTPPVIKEKFHSLRLPNLNS